MSPAENGLHSLIMIKTNLFFFSGGNVKCNFGFTWFAFVINGRTLGLPDLPSSLMGEDPNHFFNLLIRHYWLPPSGFLRLELAAWFFFYMTLKENCAFVMNLSKIRTFLTTATTVSEVWITFSEQNLNFITSLVLFRMCDCTKRLKDL